MRRNASGVMIAIKFTISMAVRFSLAPLSLIALFVASEAPALAMTSPSCATNHDCPRGWICDVESVACTDAPQANECVRKACVVDPAQAATWVERYTPEVMLRTGPGNKPELLIQIVWSSNEKKVWTVLRGVVWKRVLRGESRANTRIQVCVRRSAARSDCDIRQGQVIFSEPVTDKAGSGISGSLRYLDPESAMEVILPFSALVQKIH